MGNCNIILAPISIPSLFSVPFNTMSLDFSNVIKWLDCFLFELLVIEHLVYTICILIKLSFPLNCPIISTCSLCIYVVVIGDSYMSPSVLANMWKEEEARTKTLEDRLRLLLSNKEVFHKSYYTFRFSRCKIKI